MEQGTSNGKKQWINIVSQRWWFIGFSCLMIVASIVAVLSFGIKEGIDLKGGTQWRISFASSTVGEEQIVGVLKPIAPNGEVSVKRSDSAFLVRLPAADETMHEAYRSALAPLGSSTEQSFSSIGPTIGSELKGKAVRAIIFVLLGISLYVAYAFRKVSEPVSSWKYGIVTLVTLFHDVFIPTGLIAVLGYTHGVELDTNFIVALLVVMGFSVHDTIVVFDRIRENLMLAKGHRGESFGAIVNRSVHETFARSLNTSLTLIIVLVTLLVFGPPSLFYFILTMLVGTVFGTYSSIFLASPLLYLWGKGGPVDNS